MIGFIKWFLIKASTLLSKVLVYGLTAGLSENLNLEAKKWSW